MNNKRKFTFSALLGMSSFAFGATDNKQDLLDKLSMMQAKIPVTY